MFRLQPLFLDNPVHSIDNTVIPVKHYFSAGQGISRLHMPHLLGGAERRSRITAIHRCCHARHRGVAARHDSTSVHLGILSSSRASFGGL